MIPVFIRYASCVLMGIASSGMAAESSLTMVVMDPLALPLSCACVDGVGQRRYESFAEALSKELGREVDLIYEESLQLARRRAESKIDIVVGKRSTVLYDANETGIKLHAVASLTDREGITTVHGTVLVPKEDTADGILDLSGKRIAIGPREHAECHAAAKSLLAGVQDASMIVHESIESAVYAFDDGEVDAVVVSGFLPPLLVGCGKLQENSFREVAVTAKTPFVQAFVATGLDASERIQIAGAMIKASRGSKVRELIESQSGFATEGWTDWRGPRRLGIHDSLPMTLPAEPSVIWRGEVQGPAMAGISATENIVVVADKNRKMTEDVFRAFDAAEGKPLWTIRYPSEGKLDYTNAPRATPVIIGDRVIVQGAFGQLTCASIEEGEIIWQKDLVNDFGGELPSWGYCVPPLVIDEKVIVAPGGKWHSVMALDLRTGNTIWSTPGHAAAYAPMIYATFGGRAQVIGYDSASLAGWDLQTGERIWELIPPDNTDFHVGTPVPLDNALLVATENNATRIYPFDQVGRLIAKPIDDNQDCAPDTCTPVVAGNRVFCSAYGELFCLDATAGYETLWSQSDDRFYDHTNLIVGSGRLLLWSSSCDLMLLDASADEFRVISSQRPMSDPKAESMSHPAIVGDRIYLRSKNELLCLGLSPFQ